MAQIIPKLNLNKTPALVENNSLVFAKNIRLDVDGTVHRDFGTFPMSIIKGNAADNLVDYSNIINRIIADLEYNETDTNILNELKLISTSETDNCKIVGVIPDSNDFYLFIYGDYKVEDKLNKKSFIIKYDEKDERFYICSCNWNWSGGNIEGCVIKNLIGDTILNIGEYGISDLVPLKSINLNTSKFYDDESIYTQIPNIPITNLNYYGRFSYSIPNGVYQFFVRYKIYDNFYTDWFPASRELFVGNTNNAQTSFGSVKYVKITRDSDNSFVFSVEHLIDKYKYNYKNFQIGFILTHDDATYARAWKHFDFNTDIINFDYKAEDAEEIEVTELLKVTYGLYNVNNITTFKNKLYISNYTETNFNDDTLQSEADKVTFEFGSQKSEESYNNYLLIKTNVVNKEVVSGLKINGINTPFRGENNIFYRILESKRTNDSNSIITAISNALASIDDVNNSPSDLYGIRINCVINTLHNSKNILEKQYNNVNRDDLKITHSFNYATNDVVKILLNDKEINKEDLLYSIYNRKIYLTKEGTWIDINGNIDNTITIKLVREVAVTRTILSNKNASILDSRPDLMPDEIMRRPIQDTEDLIDSSTLTSETITFTVPYYQTININYVAWKSYFNDNYAADLTHYTTLIPYQKYKFYIHFVKSTGEITNGYYCSNIGEIEAPYMPTCNSVIYPIFKNINIPKDYVACFFSILHTENRTSTIFNIRKIDYENEGSCIDLDMMLVPSNMNMHICQELEGSLLETFDSKYYYSSDASNPKYFGANGVITFKENEIDNNSIYSKFDINNLAYIVNNYAISQTDNIELIKCTPYLNETNLIQNNKENIFNDYTQMNLLGFICDISPLDRDTCINYYSDGSSVYYKDVNSNSFHLKELSKYIEDSSKYMISHFSLKTTNNEYIYSNYNLNYVALTEDYKMAIKTFYTRRANDIITNEVNKETESNTIILRLFSSQLLSELYELPSMYKSYIRKTYSAFTDINYTKFDNTVRSSILYGDESKVYVVKFEANDYYNIPTNRGIIVNLVAIGDVILVHTKDSMFKFTGSNSLQSSEGEILTGETQPFDTGVSEMFGSDFGFAGLQNKSDHIITEYGYIFFDRDSHIVYLYSGQGQITKISENIEKLFRHKDILNIRFANDYYNNRFFMCILFYDEEKVIYPVTLSFNTSENSRAFVSLHDFYFNYAFNTKTKCYFLTKDNKDICNINKQYKGSYTKLALELDETYPQSKNEDWINVIKEDDPTLESEQFSLSSFNSIIDIIDNNQYESIKTLNAINWCGSKIKSEFTEITETNITSLMMAEDINYEIPCRYIRIYTDTCITNLLDCDKVSNNSSISSNDSYIYPRFNQGIWTLNYFRNIINSNENIVPYVSDQNSLIEGKYFVARFIFDSDFKFETLNFNTNIKL